jgi:hypothetical protein
MILKKPFPLFVFLMLAFNSCVEPFEYKTLTFESALVVEASISSENKRQSIKLSRTFKIEDSDIIPETNATIEIVDDLNNVFKFTEGSPGNYNSNVSFDAKKNVSYQLKIKTKDDKMYLSSNQKITGESPIQNIVAKATTFAESGGIDKEGIAIYVESYDADRNSNYYRYEYEETYKIVAPLWTPKELEIVSRINPYKVKLVNKTEEKKICYSTKLSNQIIQTETATLTEDRVSFPVKFIEKSDYSIKYRYSMLVKQYIQTREAYSFYKTLKKLSSTESLFSQNQPGTMIGNLYSIDNELETVLGFFEVTSFSSKRVFFNYTDFYNRSTRPKHFEECYFESPPLSDGGDEPTSPLIYLLDKGEVVFYKKNTFDDAQFTSTYILTTKSCGDCTANGSNIKPSFWID